MYNTTFHSDLYNNHRFSRSRIKLKAVVLINLAVSEITLFLVLSFSCFCLRVRVCGLVGTAQFLGGLPISCPRRVGLPGCRARVNGGYGHPDCICVVCLQILP